MATIRDVLKFEGKDFSDLTNDNDRDKVMFVADKLKALEKEILKYPEGTITIKESGEIFMTMFPHQDIMTKMNKLLYD